MKLYATVTSERASKGQGGQKWLECIMSIDQDMNKQVRLYTDGDGFTLFGGITGDTVLYESKGNKQKGEQCPWQCEKTLEYCGVHHHSCPSTK